MREYGQVQSSFWQSPDAQSFTNTGKLLAVYLLTGPHTNGIGCFRLPDGYVMADLGWSQETVSEGFAELFRKGFANRFDGVVFIPNFLRWNRIANRNIATARFGEFDQLPKGEAKRSVARAMLEFCSHWEDDQRDHIETVTQTVTQTVCQPEPNPTQPRENPKEVAPSENRSTPAEPTFIEIPLNDGRGYPVTDGQVREFSDLYPAVDVKQELRGIRAWCVSNPTKRKTRTGVLRFVNRWLAKAQDSGHSNGVHGYPVPVAGTPRQRRELGA